ncbi:hypothetical protein DXH95_14420 [Sphingorhabdus pulchriflava]|uniref:Flippase-like domain-containing protein n=2 Tax=Sphingorhabdus pulchriflava TaxID=2292257 RepID=A0A371B1L8_9SPHN|nr:hypothetical protein DXH95_14420 [Sphingorhabdus pulchriflava]
MPAPQHSTMTKSPAMYHVSLQRPDSLTPSPARRGVRALYWLGALLLAASLIFVAAYAHRNWAMLAQVSISNSKMLVLAILLYAVSHFSTALSWPFVLRGMSIPVSLRTGVQIGFVSQIGKYLPGNVAHYFGRATLAANSGVPLLSSGTSTAVEIIAALFAAAIVGATALVIDPEAAQFLALRLMNAFQATTTILAALAAGVLALGTYLYWKRYSIVVVLAPTLFLAVSFTLSGLSFAALLASIDATSPTATIIALFVVAWVIGFIVPGAPAGIGIREAILIGFLAPQIGGGPALACSLLHRVLTAGVDAAVAIFGYTWLHLSKKKKSAKDVLSGSPTSQG